MTLTLMVAIVLGAKGQVASDLYSNSRYHDGWLQTGYKGNVEFFVGGNEWDPSFSITTSHGYQFSEWFFLGGGLGYFNLKDYYDYDDENLNAVPIFGDFRLTIPNSSRFYPVADVKLGASIAEYMDGCMYYEASLGARYAINEKLGLSLFFSVRSVGYTSPSLGGGIGFDF